MSDGCGLLNLDKLGRGETHSALRGGRFIVMIGLKRNEMRNVEDIFQLVEK